MPRPAGPPCVFPVKTGLRSGVRVAEPELSPHSSCRQRDVRCLIVVGAKTETAQQRHVAGPMSA